MEISAYFYRYLLKMAIFWPPELEEKNRDYGVGLGLAAVKVRLMIKGCNQIVWNTRNMVQGFFASNGIFDQSKHDTISYKIFDQSKHGTTGTDLFRNISNRNVIKEVFL